MTVVSIASFLQEEAHPAHDVRRMVQSMFAGRGGVVPRTATFTDLKVTQRGAGANMSVDVAEGSCLVTGTESTYQGLYHAENQGVQNVTITAADATNPRRDMIVARIKDTEYGVAVTDEFVIEAVAGTPAGSPADPTIPSNCIVLARVAVAALATSITNANITDLRNGYAAVTGSATIGNQVKAVAHGGIVPCTSTFRPTKQLYEGMVIWETDTQLAYVYDGSGWDLSSFAVPTAWTAPTFVNSWTNYDTALFNACSYRKIGDIVYLRGLAKDGTINTHIFVLPVGYRPPKSILCNVHTFTGAERLDVGSDGGIATIGAAGGSNGYVSLENVSFSTTA